MKKLFYLLVISLTFISCEFDNKPLVNYTYKVNIVYQNGDSEIINISEDSYRVPILFLAEDGCLSISLYSKTHHLKRFACYVRKYEVINDSTLTKPLGSN